MLALAGAAVAGLLAGCEPAIDAQASLKSARGFIEQGKTAEAIVEAKRAVQADPKLADARHVLAQALAAGGDLPGAETELRRAIEGGLAPAQGAPMLAALLMAQGRHEVLLRDLSAVKIDDAGAQARLRIAVAQSLQQTGQVDEATRVVDQVLQAEPGFVPARLEKARLLALAGKTAEATTLADAILADDPKHAEALLLRAMLAQAAERPAGEVAALAERAIAQRPKLLEAHALLVTSALAQGDLAAARQRWNTMSQQLPRHPQTLFMDATLALREGRTDHARELVQRLLKASPDEVRLLALAAQTEAAAGSRQNAMKHLNKAAQIAPDNLALRAMQAQQALAEGDGEAALAALKVALRAQPDEVSLLMMQAQAMLMTGDVAGADAAFDRAAKLRPGDAGVRAERAMSRLMRGQEEWALSELRSAAQADPKSSSAEVAMFAARLQRGQYDAALAAADAVAAKTPGQPLADVLRGRLAIERGDLPQARKSFEAVLQKDPSHLGAIAQLAGFDLAEGQHAAARRRIDGVLQRDPTNLQALLLMAQIESKRAWADKEVDAWLQKAAKAHPNERAVQIAGIDLYLRMGQVDRARALVETLVAQQDKSPELLDRQGRVQMLSGNPSAALSTFTQLQLLQPRSPLPYLRLADAHRLKKDWSAAIQQLKKALELDPRSLEARRQLAELTFSDQGPKAGLAAVKALQKDFPADAAGWLLEGDAAAVDKQWPAAAAAYQQAMTRRRAGDAHLHAYRALVLAGNVPGAEALARDWQARFPGDRSLLLLRADRALRTGDTASAAARYREVLALDPGDPLANNNLAMLVLPQKPAEAVTLAETAVKNMPGRADFIDTLALTLAAVNRLPEALQWQAKAVAMQPDQPGLSLTLARLNVQAGKADEARAQLRKLQALGDRFGDQKEVAALLAKVGS